MQQTELRRVHPMAPVATNKMMPTIASNTKPWRVKPKMATIAHTTSNTTTADRCSHLHFLHREPTIQKLMHFGSTLLLLVNYGGQTLIHCPALEIDSLSSPFHLFCPFQVPPTSTGAPTQWIIQFKNRVTHG